MHQSVLSKAVVCFAAVLLLSGKAYAQEYFDSYGPGMPDPAASSYGPGMAPGYSSGPNSGTADQNDLYNQMKAVTNEEQAKAMMTTITVPVWRLVNGNKVSGTAKLTVNSYIADVLVQVFEEIYHGPQQFPISDAGAYSWRGDSSKSEHNWGTAIDLNSNSNYCLYANGTVVGDHWTPFKDPYSFYEGCDVVKAFENHGFTWGGNWPWGNIDYMHFSYFGT